MKIAAIVLAAGLSKRYGPENKLLSLIDGVPMIRKVVVEIDRSKVDLVLVVTGYQSELIEDILVGVDKVQLVYNDHYEEGMSTSIVKGAQDLHQMDGCMICLGDLPHLTANDYDRLIEVFNAKKATNRIIIPTFRGKRGHPVVFGQSFFDDLKNLPFSDEGARKIILANEGCVLEVEMDNHNILKDIDFNTSD
jgi:molybdenum cofactor cytidylyltransferase